MEGGGRVSGQFDMEEKFTQCMSPAITVKQHKGKWLVEMRGEAPVLLSKKLFTPEQAATRVAKRLGWLESGWIEGHVLPDGTPVFIYREGM